ncbi:hypothetical protein C0J52_09459 [Blattella germanica]|nr:hypothetical protein C0J52_09459 [Blattella germanica]
MRWFHQSEHSYVAMGKRNIDYSRNTSSASLGTTTVWKDQYSCACAELTNCQLSLQGRSPIIATIDHSAAVRLLEERKHCLVYVHYRESIYVDKVFTYEFTCEYEKRFLNWERIPLDPSWIEF